MTRKHARVFMFHRFSSDGHEAKSHPSPSELRMILMYAQRTCNVLAAEDFVGLLAEDSVPDLSVVFTIDDGYRDFMEFAYPVFIEFRTPVTLFLTTDFVYGQLWLWWDRLSFILDSIDESTALDHLAHLNLELPTDNRHGTRTLWMALTDYLREMTDEDKWEILQEFESRSGVAVPERPTQKYAPMKPEQISSLDPDLVTVGAHTISHPFLSRADTIEARKEIFGSKEILENRLDRIINLFCYPQGKFQDFGRRDQLLVEEAGYHGAFMAEPGDSRPDQLNMIPRYGASGDIVHFRWVLCGAEFLLLRIRSFFGRRTVSNAPKAVPA